MSECDWHRLWPPEGERKCDHPPAVVRDGYGGSPNMRFCAGHDPLGGSMSDAHAKAERIVMSAVEHTADDLDTHVDGLVAALAAAIEVAEWVDRSPTMRGYLPDRASTRQLLAAQMDALSALRRTDGEDA